LYQSRRLRTPAQMKGAVKSVLATTQSWLTMLHNH
jgi:hypothetical protein